MISQASYSDGTRTATITLERIDTWLEEDQTVINFPGRRPARRRPAVHDDSLVAPRR